MRTLLVLLVLLAPAGFATAASGEPSATLEIDVEAEHAESMHLSLDGLHRLTIYQGICLPAGARETRVYDELGDLPHEAKDENGRRVLSFSARSQTVQVDMARPAPAEGNAPLFAADANFCVPSGSTVTVNVRVPADHTLFFLSDGGHIADGRNGTTTSDGPTHVFYAYEAPFAADALSVFDEGPFRVFVAPALAERAREVATLASAPVAAALSEAGLDRPFDAIRVLYAAQTPFEWEAGHYNGQGFVEVKASTLSPEPSDGYPYSAVKVLVHESFHAASFPYGKGPVEDAIAWWLEGTARRSERHVDGAMPNASSHCEKTMTEVKCWSFDDRITRAELDSGYAPGFTFDASWEPSLPQSEDTRRFYYGFSEFVVGAWIDQNGEPGYRRAWDRIFTAFNDGGGCPCSAGWLETVLDSNGDALFRPWDGLRLTDAAGFDARVMRFVKDEAALERELAEQADPLNGVPAPGWLAICAIATLALARARRA